MLTGLIFATEDASDRPDQLAAALPFGGSTLVEFQARMLLAVGVGHILVAVERVTPELVGAINRIARRGVPVDTVRSARDAADRLHPLAQVLVLADGLVTTEAVLALMAGESGDALLVTSDARALPGLERVGADAVWAGVARLSAGCIDQTAALPRDYDFGSTLLRVAAQGGARQVTLPFDATTTGHGLERDSQALKRRNDAVVAAHLASRPTWVDRFVHAPVSRRLLPLLAARGATALTVAGGAVAVLAVALVLMAIGWSAAGLLLVIVANAALMTGSVLSWMRDDEKQARVQAYIGHGGTAAAVLLLGRGLSAGWGTASGLILAVILVVLAALMERAALGRPRRLWWATTAAYPLLLWPFVLPGYGGVGLGIAGCYAAISLAATIESLRRQP